MDNTITKIAAEDTPSSKGYGSGSIASPRIGKVATPPQKEATTDEFYFWVRRDTLVEKAQIIRAECVIGGQTIQFFAIVDQMFRQSRKKNMGEEIDEADGDPDYIPQFLGEGVTYARANILRTDPPVMTPPMNGSPVYLCDEQGASFAYGADEIENGLAVGMIKNGDLASAGPGFIDLDYLLGENGGHMNVNGVAGRGTKSSFLLFTIYMLLAEARRRAQERPSDRLPLLIAPIILNVKGFDLFFIDRLNHNFDPDKHLAAWQELGFSDPQPFEKVIYCAPQMPSGTETIPTGALGKVFPYSWSLSDVIERGLLLYLFADEDVNDANFGALVLDLENWLAQERRSGGVTTRNLRKDKDVPQTFDDLLDMIGRRARGDVNDHLFQSHYASTWRKLHRRLIKLLLEGNGVLRRDDLKGNPLVVTRKGTSQPIVVDLNGLSRIPSLQRFVVATIFRQLVDDRTGPAAVSGLVYLVALDELNRFAPRGSNDPITQLIETVAAEMRSQGIILLGAQQQASRVSEKVIENAAIRVLGRSGSLELSQSVWRFLSDGARRKAAGLRLDEKLVIQDNFREPMLVKVPFPAWALRPREAALDRPDSELTGSEDDSILAL